MPNIRAIWRNYHRHSEDSMKYLPKVIIDELETEKCKVIFIYVLIINTSSVFWAILDLLDLAYVPEPKENKYFEIIIGCVSSAMAVYSKYRERKWIYPSFMLNHLTFSVKIFATDEIVGNDVKNRQEQVIILIL